MMSFATEQNFRPIPEYPNFDASRHFYSIESGGGDGWLAHQPLMDALERDLQNVIDDDISLVELCDIEAGEWLGWINALYVFEKGREANEVAEFDLAAWEWLETSSTSRADRRKTMSTKAEQLNIDVRAAMLMVSSESIEDVTRALCDEFGFGLTFATSIVFRILSERKDGRVNICTVVTQVNLETLGAVRLAATDHGSVAAFLRQAIKEKLERDSQ